MRRSAVLLSAFTVVLVLGGCSSMSGSNLVFGPSSLPAPSGETSGSPGGRSFDAAAVNQTVLAAGTTVHMANGLTLTVPKGWRATLTRYDGSAPHIPGALGTRNASELLVLQQDRMGHRVRISSSQDEGTARLHEMGYHPVLASTVATAFEVGSAQTGAAPPLAVIRTHSPNAAFGLMVFVHIAGRTTDSVEGVWRLFKIKGVAAPLMPITTL